MNPGFSLSLDENALASMLHEDGGGDQSALTVLDALLPSAASAAAFQLAAAAAAGQGPGHAGDLARGPAPHHQAAYQQVRALTEALVEAEQLQQHSCTTPVQADHTDEPTPDRARSCVFLTQPEASCA